MRTGFLATLLVLLGVESVVAGNVVSTSGAVVQVSPPGTTREGFVESDTDVILFVESQHVTLGSDIPVDISTTGLFDQVSDLTPGIIPAGTRVDSHYLQYDPVNPGTVSGSVTLDAPILGMVVYGATLAQSSDILGHPGTLYTTTDSLNIGEGGSIGDFLILSADRLTLSFEFHATTGPDYVRFISTSIPEPSAGFLLACGLFACAFVHQRMKKN